MIAVRGMVGREKEALVEVKWVNVGGVLKPEWDFPSPVFQSDYYNELVDSRHNFRLVNEYIVPVNERGKGFIVHAGQAIRISCIEGAQMTDVGIWNADNPKEYFWNDATLSLEGAFLTKFSRLWGTNPNFRPLMTIIVDTVDHHPTIPCSGAHTCLTAHCDPHYWYWALKDQNHPYVTTNNCYYNLIKAIIPFGLTSENLHDNINFFMKTGFLETGKHVVLPSDVKKGDYVELFAEIDVLVALSICPGGSGNLHYSEREQDSKPLCVQIFDTGFFPLKNMDQLEIGTNLE
jgi:uncharacterized protein YcgI (DUF1989 family)